MSRQAHSFIELTRNVSFLSSHLSAAVTKFCLCPVSDFFLFSPHYSVACSSKIALCALILFIYVPFHSRGDCIYFPIKEMRAGVRCCDKSTWEKDFWWGGVVLGVIHIKHMRGCMVFLEICKYADKWIHIQEHMDTYARSRHLYNRLQTRTTNSTLMKRIIFSISTF